MYDDDTRHGGVDQGFRRTFIQHVEAADIDVTAMPTPATLRAAGARRRRARLAGLLTAGAVAAIAYAGPMIERNPPTVRTATATTTAITTTPPVPLDLPASTGHGPGIAHFTAPGYTPGGWVGGVAHAWQRLPVRGSMTTIATTTSGDRIVLFTTLNGFFCSGRVAQGQEHPEDTACQALAGLPAEGFFATHGRRLGAEGVVSTSGPSIVFGVVRGPVTRVVLRTRGVQVEATLATAPTPDLGRFYWSAVDAGSSNTPGPPDVELVAYEGDQPRFVCTEDDRACQRQP